MKVLKNRKSKVFKLILHGTVSKETENRKDLKQIEKLRDPNTENSLNPSKIGNK